MKPVFLTGKWCDLLMANYRVDPALLHDFLPYGTELDFFQGRCYVSLVGFMFKNVRVLGYQIPLHVNFPEVNLRFYVKYKHNDAWRRGVVFLSEIVPKRAIALVANYLYHERYVTAKMVASRVVNENGLIVGHQWRWRNRWNKIEVTAESSSTILRQGSEEEFITEHYWGYSRRSTYHTNEYQVEHPRWNTHRVNTFTIDCDFAGLYGQRFAFLQNKEPDSIFLADGSDIIIRKKSSYFGLP